MQGILFDLDGVIYQGDEALPGAAQTLAWVKQQGIPHLFVTNTSSQPRQAIVARLAALGMTVQSDQLLTPPSVAGQRLASTLDGPVAAFVKPAVQPELGNIPLLPDDAEAGAAAVVVGDLGDDWCYETLNRALRLLLDGKPPLLALGMTRYWQAPDGLRLDVGAMVSALGYASNREPIVLGKPSPLFFRAALDVLGMEAEHVLMIGDDILGDVQGAQRAGLRAGLVRTGKFRPPDLNMGVVPDVILDDVGALPRWWGSHPRGKPD